MKFLPLLAFCSLLTLATARGQEGEESTPEPAVKPARSAYQSIKLQALPRDENGFLKPEIWDIIEAEAKAVPGSNEARVLGERKLYQDYYKTYADWKAPEPLPVQPGYLRNLAETPKQPRFPVTDPVWPAQPGDASVCLWEDDKLAAMSLGVDDNCATDLPFWKELSRKYGGLNITWNLITDNISGALSKGRSTFAGSWETWQQTVDEGYHVASHSMTHNHAPVPADGWPGPAWEAAESKRLIDTHLKNYRTRVYAYPGSGVHVFGAYGASDEGNPWRNAISKYYVAARGAGGDALNQVNMTDYFNVHATTGSVPELLGSKIPRMAAQNVHNLFNADPANPYHKYYRGWANIFIHFVNGGKNWDTNPGDQAYARLLEFYSQNRDKLWTGFFDDIALYGEERDTATLTTEPATNDRLAFTLVSKMEPTIYDYPLTIKVRLPDAWKQVTARQNDAALPAQVIVHEGSPFVLVKVVPGRGQVTVTAAK